MSTRRVEPSGPLRGTLRVPGDKSISHRSLLLNALGTGSARVRGLLDAGDVRATADAVRQLGVSVERDGDGWRVTPPPAGLQEPQDVIDCGNSGTSMRLLAGVLAPIPGLAVLTGDRSLRRRPMRRVVDPLRAMGARIDGRRGGELAPLAVRGTPLKMGHHDLAIASAQVKSALLLAGLTSGVAVREPRRSRDHTERMLQAMGVGLRTDPEGWIVLVGGQARCCVDVDVPGDLSSAAFPLVAATLVAGSHVRLVGVGLNPTRSGVIDALLAMGAEIEVLPHDALGPEPQADLVVRHAKLHGVRIDGELALRCLDELPVLAVAAACAEGRTVIADAAELRVKESDRITRVAEGLSSLGVDVTETPDGMVIEGGALRAGDAIDATGDHRLAMAFSVAGLVTPDGVEVQAADAVASSWPAFYDDLAGLVAP